MFNMFARLLETSVLVFFEGKHVRVVFAIVIVMISIVVHREAEPYRQPSDNALAYVSQWALFLW